MKNLLQAAVLGAALFVTACAEYPKNITAAYIPSIVYRGASCSEIMHERAKLVSRVRQIAAAQQRTANTDTAGITVFFVTPVIVAWAGLLTLPFTQDQSAQLAVARGHYDALVKASHEQGCSGANSMRQTYQAPSHYSGIHNGNWKRYRGEFPPL